MAQRDDLIKLLSQIESVKKRIPKLTGAERESAQSLVTRLESKAESIRQQIAATTRQVLGKPGTMNDIRAEYGRSAGRRTLEALSDVEALKNEPNAALRGKAQSRLDQASSELSARNKRGVSALPRQTISEMAAEQRLKNAPSVAAPKPDTSYRVPGAGRVENVRVPPRPSTGGPLAKYVPPGPLAVPQPASAGGVGGSAAAGGLGRAAQSSGASVVGQAARAGGLLGRIGGAIGKAIKDPRIAIAMAAVPPLMEALNRRNEALPYGPQGGVMGPVPPTQNAAVAPSKTGTAAKIEAKQETKAYPAQSQMSKDMGVAKTQDGGIDKIDQAAVRKGQGWMFDMTRRIGEKGFDQPGMERRGQKLGVAGRDDIAQMFRTSDYANKQLNLNRAEIEEAIRKYKADFNRQQFKGQSYAADRLPRGTSAPAGTVVQRNVLSTPEYRAKYGR